MGVRNQEGSGADMSYNGPEVPLYRPSKRWDVPYEEWKDEAACQGQPTHYFELGDAEGSGYDSDYQHKLIAKGLSICVGCPVRAACKNNSTKHDRYWTVRGGQPPEGLFEDSKMPHYSLKQQVKGGFAPGKGPEREPKKTCKRGHENWRTKKDGRRFCESCRQLQESKRWKESKYKGVA